MKETRPKGKAAARKAAKEKHGEAGAAKTEQAAAEPEVQPPEAKTAEGAAHVDEAAALRERLIRLQADFENFRKRTLREKNELYQRANEDIMEELLPVMDHLDLALSSVPEPPAAGDADAAFVEGVRLVATQLVSALGKFGLTPIDAEGGAFDHNLHEAIAHLPSESVPENGIVAQTRRGYKLGERLLRPAQVVVSNGPASPDAQATDAAAGETGA